MIIVKGPLIPNRLIQETDVLKIEPEKDSPEYWKQYWTELEQSAEDFINSPQMPIYSKEQMMFPHEKQLAIAEVSYLRLGFQIPEILPAEYEESFNDRLYIVAVLPEGWKKIKGDYSEGFCYVVDNKGARRVEVWIMNTSTERRASYRICGRYEPYMKVQTVGTDHIHFGAVRDNKLQKTLYTSNDSVNVPVDGIKNAITVNKLSLLRAESTKWLNENYPEWKNPFTYWDTPH